MSKRAILGHATAIGLIMGLLVMALPSPAHAGLGDVLSPTPVTITSSIAGSNPTCGGGPATAIALVQGSKISPGFPTLPVLVVTSCHSGGSQGVLHFLDPATGVEKATLTTLVSP